MQAACLNRASWMCFCECVCVGPRDCVSSAGTDVPEELRNSAFQTFLKFLPLHQSIFRPFILSLSVWEIKRCVCHETFIGVFNKPKGCIEIILYTYFGLRKCADEKAMVGNMTEPGLVEKSLEAKMNRQLHLHEEKEWEEKNIPMKKNCIKESFFCKWRTGKKIQWDTVKERSQ